VIFAVCIVVVFFFCVGVVYISFSSPEIHAIINWTLFAYFSLVGSFLVCSLRGSYADFEKLRELQKAGGILPTRYKRLDIGTDDDAWAKWD
jgi:hypothetical protein